MIEHSRRALLVAPFLALRGKAQTAPRNVLFLVADDLNTDLGCYGHPLVKSPHLDRLASRGVVFDKAYCQYPLCQPSRTSFLSGLRPETTKVWTLQTPTRRHIGDAVMLPELYRKHGYFTAHAGKVYHTGEHAEDKRSWDEELREFGKSPPKAEVVREDTESVGPRGHSFEWHVLKTRDEDTPDGIVARKIVTWLEQCARDKRPFFLGGGFRRPHAPYGAPRKYFDQYPTSRIKLPPDPPSQLGRLLPAAINHDAPATPLPEEAVREHMAAYYACNTFMDAQVGVILEALDRLRLWETTSIVFLGDHGYHLADHGGLWHKSTLFERSCQVPLIAYAPGARAAGKRCGRLVELVDLYPSLAAQCGLQPPANLAGRDFTPLLNHPAQPWKEAAFTMMGRGTERAEAVRDIKFIGRSVRTERYRYTEWDGGKQGVELYDYQTDPREAVNRAGDARLQPVRARLSGLLNA
ncbi:MAG: sulfatase [Acidobacteria bacterium]|nr:sulfatase [Acidobacteriota bacterium]